jgi:hypothetical protein
MAIADAWYALTVDMARTIRSELNIPFVILELDCLDGCVWEANSKLVVKLRTNERLYRRDRPRL